MMKKYIRNYLTSIGLFTLLVLALHCVFPEKMTFLMPKLLLVMVIGSLITQIAYACIFKVGCSKRELWLRRIACEIISGIAYSLCVFVFVLGHLKPIDYIIYLFAIMAAMLILSAIVYCITDITERRHIERINQKLDENGRQEK